MATTPADLTRLAFGRLNDSLLLPATPAMMVARMSSETLAFAPTVVESPELDPSGQLRDSILVGSGSTGNVEFPLVRSDWFHAMLAAVFRSDWGEGMVSDETAPGVFSAPRAVLADELIPGREVHMFDVEKLFATPDAPSYHVFRRNAVGSLALRVVPNDLLTGTVALLGSEMETAATPLAGATYPDPGTYRPFTSPNVTEASMSGVTNVQCFNGITLTFNSNVRSVPCVGTLADREKALGRFVPTVDGTTYFTDNEHLEALIDQRWIQMTVTLTDGSGNAYEFFYPRLKFITAPVTTPGTNQDVMLPVAMRGHYSPQHGYSVRVTRTLVVGP